MSTKDELARRRAALSPDQLARLRLRISQASNQSLPASTIPRRALDTPAPLSFAQQRLWFLQQLDPENTAYNELIALRLIGKLDYAALKQAMGMLIQRHEILRTTFPLHEGLAVQEVAPGLDQEMEIPLLSLQMLPHADRLPRAHEMAEEMQQQIFRLAEEFPRCFRVLQLDREEHIFLACLHHIITDAWSLELFIKELIVLYRACVENQAAPLPDLPLQYSDYAAWQRGEGANRTLMEQAAYWQTTLKAPLPVLELPIAHPRPPILSNQGARQSWIMPDTLRQALSRLCLREGITPFMALLSAFAVLLARYTALEDVIIGTPVAGRNQPELETLLGCFINTLPLRVDLSGHPTFQEVLRRVRATVLAATDRQDVPFEKLVELLQPARNTSQHPIFQTMFVLQNVPQVISGPAELTIAPFEVEVHKAMLDLALVLRETPVELSGYLEYNTNLFESSAMSRLLTHYQRLLEYVIAHPDTRIHEVPFLTENEQRLSHPQSSLPARTFYLHELFAEQARQTPEAGALVMGEEWLSYRELDRRANRLAWRLRRLGAGPEVAVGVYLERSFELVISFLAILKAGGVYVPLDRELPAERLSGMLEQAHVTLLLTRPELANSLPTHEALIVDPCACDVETEDAEMPPEVELQPHHLAYIIYTSGSTGRPKGVLIEHHGLAGHIMASLRAFGIDRQSRIAQLATCSFDVSILEIGLALLSGATLYLGSSVELLPGPALQAFLRRHAITHITLAPSLLATLDAATLPDLQTVIPGGEALAPDLARQWAEQCCLINAYGPTEATIDTTSDHYHAGATLTLGYPFPYRHVVLLDAHLAPVPIGVAGEIFIGGLGVARGYLHQPDLTAERFIPDPFTGMPGARLYKTGDLARYCEDGRIEFLGRVDRQVKLRGFRIELEEIEAILAQHSTIARCTVMAREDTPGDQRLVAYIILQTERYASPEELQGYLKERLPAYMLPAVFVYLAAFPLLANGKLNRQALPPPDLKRPELETGFVAARDPVAEILARIWSSLLNVTQVGVQDNFFTLGGHSLLAVQVIARIRAAFGVELPLAKFIHAATLADLTDEVKSLLKGGPEQARPPLERSTREQNLPLSSTQQRQWFLAELHSDQQFYQVSGAVHLRGPLHVAALVDALNEIVRRHEILRTTFVADSHGTPRQVIAPELRLSIPEIALDHLSAAEQEAAIRAHLAEEQQRPLDLARGPLVFVTVLHLAPNEHILLLTSHHMLFDGWSVEIFLYELATLYAAFSAGEPSPLAELPLQYADYACWQQRVLSGPALADLLAYWREQLADLPTLALPTLRPRPSQQVFDAQSIAVTLSSELTSDLQALSNRCGVTLFMVLLAAFQAVLARYSRQQDIVVGSPSANRHDTRLESLIGNFLNTLVLRTNLSGNPTFQELLQRVRQMTLDAYAHQELPFEQLVADLRVEQTGTQNPLFQVLFAFQNHPRQKEVDLPGLSADFLSSEDETTTFDLDLTMWEENDELAGSLKYNTYLFDSEFAHRIRNDFVTFLTLVAANPQQQIEDVPLLSLDDLLRQLADWNATEVGYAQEQRIHQLFEAQADRTPGALAAICGQRVLTYGELERQANQVARYLRTHGVAPGDMVALLLERSLEMLPALLGVLKAGACYVPLETSYPAARVHWILQALHIGTLLTQSTQLETLRSLEPLPALQHVIYLDAQADPLETPQASWQSATWQDIARLPDIRMPDGITSNALAYVIFTSGSTGTPKGVMVRHQPVINLIEWVNRTFEINAADRVLFITSLCFDLSVYDIFGLLAAGGSILIASGEEVREPARLLDLLHTQPITFWDSAPAALQQLVPFFTAQDASTAHALRLVFLSGDWIPLKLPDEVHASFPGAEVVSLGGATEATVWSNFYRFAEVDPRWASIPYGRPIQNAQYYILDANFAPCPPGVPGDLYIGGACLSTGYAGEPELTAQKFLPSPFGTEPGARLYKTGDLARFESNGVMEFLGRSDTQVKIRGFRVEPGEIEAALARHPGVEIALVEARRDTAGEKRLVAYVVADGTSPLSREGLYAHLRALLPTYMLPAAFVFLPKLPVTANGKVDRRRLPDPEALESAEGDEMYIAPRDTVEEQLAQIWGELLNLPRVSVTEDFFLIGGHSLLTVRLMARIESQFGKRLPLATIFQHRTIEALAKVLRRHATSSLWSLLLETRLPEVNLPAEARLDLEIPQASEASRPTHAANSILLTGATGFLGVFLLAELLQQTRAEIYCLLRVATPAEGAALLQQRLQEASLWRPEYLARLKVVPGNLALPLLGLDEKAFDLLASLIDTIYHNGAATSTLYPYQELKATNVQGTREILRLASRHHLKMLHYISTLSVLPHKGETRVQSVREDDDLDEYHDYVRGGYAQSKWVAERMVTHARECGLPVAIYRPGRITGDSQSGIWRVDDLLALTLRGCIQLGLSPSSLAGDALEMMPVDYVSKAIVAISRREDAPGRTFHLTSPTTLTSDQLVAWINMFGYPVQQVEYRAWLRALKHAQETGQPNALAPFLDLLPEPAPARSSDTPAPEILVDDSNTRAALATTSITCPPADARLLHTYLTCMVEKHVLDAPPSDSFPG